MLTVAIEAAREAGRFLKYSVGKVRTVEVKQGEPRNLVSEIDRGSEERIISIIRRHYPAHAILAEEGGGSGTKSDTTWIIDPLDGTTNFLHGVPIFAVTIGIERHGEIVAGVTYNPNTDELYTAEKGSGAYVNGKRLRVSESSELVNSLLVTGFPYDLATHPGKTVEHFIRLLMEAQGVRRLGSAALDLAYVAGGKLDGFWEGSLNPWDMAAGALLVEEAGGRVSGYDGTKLDLYNKTIVASNGKIHDAMIALLGSS
jgi:myo-inositol-1(or 4)-monophosphatase